MKITIIKSDVSLDLDLDPQDLVADLHAKISEALSIPVNYQTIYTVINGSIVSFNQVQLRPSEKLEKYSLNREFFLQEQKTEGLRRESSSLNSSFSYEPGSFENWVLRAVRYSKDGNFEGFMRLKDEFSYTSFSSLKEKTFGDLINSTVELGWNCLHFVCRNGHSGILQVLLSNGSECNLETEDGWTPLSLVSFYGYLICTEILLNQSCIQVNKKTELKGAALHQACAGGNLKIVKLLMDSNASPYIENSIGQIPLQLSNKVPIAELIAKYIGLDFLNKYTKTEKLESHSGELYWTASWQINDKQVLLVLNMDSGTISHYQKKPEYITTDQPDMQIPICEIQDVQFSEESLSENKYFIIIRTLKETFKYYSKNFEVSNLWVGKIRTAVKHYIENSDEAVKATYRKSQLITIFNFEDINFEEFDKDQNESVSFASFEVIREVGSGSFGKVFKVVKKNTGKRYAMKVIGKLELKRSNKLKYVIAECKILKKIKCPFIVPLYWAFQTPNNIYMIFEYCPNGDLSQQVREGGLSEDQVRFYVSEIVLALEFLHDLDIIYRDLKPQNILIDETCHLKLGDFGLARQCSGRGEYSSKICGSPSYMSPEMINNSLVWKASDVYSLGVCIYELLVGKVPFDESNPVKLYKSVLNNKVSFPASLSNCSKNLIQSLMNKNPEKRLTISEVKKHLFFESVDWDAAQLRQGTPPIWIEESKEIEDQAYICDKDYSSVRDQMFTSNVLF